MDSLVKSTSWNTWEVGYFYPDNRPGKAHFETEAEKNNNGFNGDKHTLVFHNVNAFVNHLRGILVFKAEKTVRANIIYCLRANALEWYMTELSDDERQKLCAVSVEHDDGWFNKLLWRFRLPSSLSMRVPMTQMSNLTASQAIYNHIRDVQPKRMVMPIFQLSYIIDLLQNDFKKIYENIEERQTHSGDINEDIRKNLDIPERSEINDPSASSRNPPLAPPGTSMLSNVMARVDRAEQEESYGYEIYLD